MNTYLADVSHFQPAHQAPAETVFAWLIRQLDARRQRQAAKRHIKYLRTLDRQTLEDIGVDIASLGEIRPSLMQINPHVIAVSAIMGSRILPTHVSSR